jgi:hypothetical protein
MALAAFCDFREATERVPWTAVAGELHGACRSIRPAPRSDGQQPQSGAPAASPLPRGSRRQARRGRRLRRELDPSMPKSSSSTDPAKRSRTRQSPRPAALTPPRQASHRLARCHADPAFHGRRRPKHSARRMADAQPRRWPQGTGSRGAAFWPCLKAARHRLGPWATDGRATGGVPRLRRLGVCVTERAPIRRADCRPGRSGRPQANRWIVSVRRG